MNTSRDSGLRADATAVEGSRVASGPPDTNAESYPVIKKVVSPLHARGGKEAGQGGNNACFLTEF